MSIDTQPGVGGPDTTPAGAGDRIGPEREPPKGSGMPPQEAGWTDPLRRSPEMAQEWNAPYETVPPGYAGPIPAGPYWRGDRLVDPRVQDLDRVAAVGVHIWWAIGLLGLGPFALLIPVVVWAVRQNSSGFVDDHGREAINAQLTLLLFAIVPIFWLILPVWAVIYVISGIRAAAAAGRREHFRYPMIFRPLR